MLKHKKFIYYSSTLKVLNEILNEPGFFYSVSLFIKFLIIWLMTGKIYYKVINPKTMLTT